MLVYWCRTWRIALTLYSLVTRFVLVRIIGCRMSYGIRLIAFPPHDFVTLNEVVEAVDLICRLDPLRFRRMQRHIKKVVLADWKWSRNPKTLARYVARTHECHVRKFPVPQNARFATVYEYTHLLVHEATHG